MDRSLIFVFSIVTSLFTSAVMADDNHKVSSQANVKTSGDAVAMTVGEIKRIDKESARITIKHNELKNLDMPAMTMVFQVKNLSILDQVEVGDQVSFVADSVDGKLVITRLELESDKHVGR